MFFFLSQDALSVLKNFAIRAPGSRPFSLPVKRYFLSIEAEIKR